MADIIDLYGGSVEIYFKSKDGVARSLRNIVFGEGGDGNSDQFANFVSHAKVHVSLLRFTNIEVTFNPPFDQAIKLIQSGVLGIGFSIKSATGEPLGNDKDFASASKSSINFNTVVIKFHHGGKQSPYFKGLLLVPEVKIGVDGISITIKATGMYFEQTKVSSGKPSDSKTGLQLIQSLLGPEIEISIDPNDSQAAKALSKIHKINMNQSNFSIANDILHDANCSLYQSGMKSKNSKPVYELISKDFMRKRKSGATFVLWSQINPNKGVYPIINMQTDINNYLAGQSFGLNATGIDSSTKARRTEKAGAESAKRFTDTHASRDGSISGSGAGKKVKTIHVPNSGEGHSLAGTVVAAVHAALESALRYEITTVGIVDLLPGRPVKVTVAGVPFLSGAYDLYEVTHEMSDSGIETHVNLAMTGGFSTLIDSGLQKLQSGAESVSSGLGVDVRPETSGIS
jgi:hypothetical protein